MREVDNILRLKNKAVESFISDRGVYAAEWEKWTAKLKNVDPSLLPTEVADRIFRGVISVDDPDSEAIKEKAKMVLTGLPDLGIDFVFPSMFDGDYKADSYKFDFKVYSVVKEVYRDALEKEIAKVKEYL